MLGKLSATRVLPNDLLAQKLAHAEVLGKLIYHEENVSTLLGRVTASQTTTIPSDFAYLTQSLTLDANLLGALPGKKLYGDSITVEPDVTPEALDAAIEALMLTGLLIAPAALRTVLAQKCNLLETEAVFYTDELWLVDDESTLFASRFDYLEGKATLVVRGDLMIEAEVEPQLLAQHFSKVYNRGSIHCTPAQMSALQARMGTNKGEFVHPSDSADVDENVFGNVSYLAL